MYMHLIARPARDAASRPPAVTLTLRTVLRGAEQVAWRNRRVRLDEDAWLIIANAVPVIEPLGRDVLGHAVVVDAGAFADLAFSEHLRPISDAAGARLAALGRARGAGRAPGAEAAEIEAMLDEARTAELALRRRAARIASVKEGTRDELLRRVLLAADFILSHFDEPISLDDIAGSASLSRFHFVRLFRIVHGVTPHAFLLQKRTAVARRELAAGSCCDDAAARAGFGSRSALFRNLRKNAMAGAAAPSWKPSPACCPCA